MVFVKKQTFFLYLCFKQTNGEEIFFNIVYREECFLDLKSEVLKKSKKLTFFKGFIVHICCQIINIFLMCLFLSKKAKKKHFLIFLIEKKCLLDLKTEVQKKSKKQNFAKGLVHRFCQKIDLFLICLFFEKESQKETFFDILDKKCFSDLKSEVLKQF